MVRAQKKLFPVISETFPNGIAFIAWPFWGIGVMNSTLQTKWYTNHSYHYRFAQNPVFSAIPGDIDER